MNKKEKLNKQLSLMICKAHRSLEAAKVLFREEDFGAVSSKSYYAVFHMLQAALLTKGLSFSKHLTVINAFSNQFIKSEIYPREFSKEIKRLKKNREVGDYEYLKAIQKEEAEEDLKSAEKIVSAIELHIENFMKRE
ncbi:MAG: HEPN domain-containing protein [candidate division Zixibacteria bacterium]|nr:HEPN domain-containing protein [candidate division Zixibacteria bacterium]